MTLSTSPAAFAPAQPHAVDTAHSSAAAVTMRAIPAADWDRLSADFDGICQEQTFTFATHRWPGLNHEAYLFEEGGIVVGGVLLMLQPLPIKLTTISLVKWGPVLRDETRSDAAALYRGMVEALIAAVSRRRRMMLSVMPRHARDDWQARALDGLGFHTGAQMRYPDRYVVDVTADAGARMAGFAQKWRYHLKKSFKAQLEFSHEGPEALDQFVSLYRAMAARKQFTDHSAIETLPALMAMSAQEPRPELFLVRQQGRPVAGAVVFTHGATATYLYGATADCALDLRAGYFLHWHILRWLAANTTVSHYDLGGTDGFQGLHQFKRGMVGTMGYIAPMPPILHRADSRGARWIGLSAFAARETLNNARRGLAAGRARLMPARRERR